MDFKEIFKQLKGNAEELAKLTLKNYVEDAKKDSFAFLDITKDKLERWTILLSEGNLSTEEFEWLVVSQKDLAVMKLLHGAGLAKIRIDQFRNSLVNLVIDTVFELVL